MVAPAWCERFTRLQYADKGRGPVEFDCWGFVRFVEREHFGDFSLPDLKHEYESAEDREQIAKVVYHWELQLARTWRRVDQPHIGDIVMLKIAGNPWHCGVCVGGDWMMHMQKGVNVALEHFTREPWRNRIEGFYRHV